MGSEATYTARVTKIMHHCVQRQPLYCAAKPPTTGLQNISTYQWRFLYTYPRDGPINGAIKNTAVIFARWCGGNKSALLPAPTAKAGLPVRPAKNRHTIKLAKLLLNPAPSVNSVKTGEDNKYTIFLPCFSLRGALMIGPNARPSVYTVIPTSAAVRETLNSAMISARAGVYTDVPNVLRRLVVERSERPECYLHREPEEAWSGGMVDAQP